MKVWLFHEPNGAWVRYLWPLADHPVRFVSFVLVEVSSIKMSRANDVLKNRLRRLIHRSRARAISGRSCSAALRLFFMTEPEPMQQAANRRAIDRDPAPKQLNAQFIQRHIAILGQPRTDPVRVTRKLAAAQMSLPSRLQRAGGPLQDHHVVHKSRRNSEMSGGFPVTIAFLDKRNNTRTQFNRMRLAHGDSPFHRQMESQVSHFGNLNQESRNLL